MNTNLHRIKISLIGYGNEPPKKFYKRMDLLNPDLIVDVRASPRGRLRSYDKASFEEKYGDRYVWIRELGNPSKDPNNIQLIDEKKGLEKLLELIENYEHIVLMCSCLMDAACHRRYVKNKLIELQGEEKVV